MKPTALAWTVAAALSAAGSFAVRGDDAPAPKSDDAVRKLVEALGTHGIRLDPERKLCSLEVKVGIRDDLLEYVLVNPLGQSHESLFTSDVPPRALNTALLALGVQAGENVRVKEKDPPPTPEELRDGAPAYTIEPPSGDGFYLYAAWREADEIYWYRVEDLVRDLETGRGMRRHRWVFLGSKTAPDKKHPGQELFAAEVEGNLVNLALFEQGFTLVTTALPECIKQTIWLPNAWLLPERGEKVLLVFARERLTELPADWLERLPKVEAPERR
ncbi:MAG: hypothetical protein HZA53_09880 [Planctomycetes bacterium]|nr:hypothetical protein [Planctomycetota bacterium]